ncbi:Uncharacterised protein, partial [Metamycoplasma alkalescens]
MEKVTYVILALLILITIAILTNYLIILTKW